MNFEQLSQNRRASLRAVEMQGRKRSVGGGYIPQKILIVGLPLEEITGVVAGEIQRCTTAEEVAGLYGYGSELHRQAIRIFSAMGGFYENVYCCPLAQAQGASQATSQITFLGTALSSGTHFFYIAGRKYELNVPLGSTAQQQAEALVSLITKDINAPVRAEYALVDESETVTITSKTKSVTANETTLLYNCFSNENSLSPSGVTVTLSGTKLTGGTGTPDTTIVFNKNDRDNLGDVWYTMITCPYKDQNTLNIYNNALEARQKPEVNRLAGTFIAFTSLTYTQALIKPESINSKYIGAGFDSRVICPEYEFAAAQIGNLAYYAMLDPGRPNMDTLLFVESIIGSDSSYPENDALFKAGMSYYKQNSSGMIQCGDIALTYRTTPQGASTEEWFDFLALTLRQQKVFDILEMFKSEPFVRPIAVDNASKARKTYCIRPSVVVSYLLSLIDYWDVEGWTKNTEEVKSSVVAEINAGYNGRIDAELTDDGAQALRIIAIKYAFLY